jgi:hypothetical protein
VIARVVALAGTLVMAFGALLLPATNATFTAEHRNVGNVVAAGEWLAPAGTVTFSTVGAHAFTVPLGHTTVTVEAWGAQGGGSSGGLGGYATAVVPVTSGEVLVVNVGERPSGQSRGWNGGGRGGNGGSILYIGNFNPGSGGGGASDVRRQAGTLTDRLVVAGGGGGASSGGGGTGGGSASGASGVGGDGADGGLLSGTLCAGGGGGGGGGHRGGAGGGMCAGGGGGSSAAVPGATDVRMTAGVRSGNGQVVISWGS